MTNTEPFGKTNSGVSPCCTLPSGSCPRKSTAKNRSRERLTEGAIRWSAQGLSSLPMAPSHPCRRTSQKDLSPHPPAPIHCKPVFHQSTTRGGHVAGNLGGIGAVPLLQVRAALHFMVKVAL